MVLVRSILLTVISACLCFAPAVVDAAGWFYLDPINIEAEIRFDGNVQSTDGVTENKQFLLEEYLRFNQSGFILSPAISSFSIEVIPVFRQDRRTIGEEKEKGKGNDLNYGFNLSILRGAKGLFDANITSSRTTNVNDTAFATPSKTDISAHEFLFNWKNSYLPVQFTYSQGSFFQEFDETTGAARAWRDEDRKRYALSANNSKLQLRLNTEHVDENVRGDDYKQSRALFRHLVAWGKGSSLRSLVNAWDRTGFSAFRQFNWSETATIQHTNDLVSTTEYNFASQETPGQDDLSRSKTQEQRGLFRLEHSFYDNLTSDGRFRARIWDADQVDQTELVVGGGAIYQKTFFFGAGCFAES